MAEDIAPAAEADDACPTPTSKWVAAAGARKCRGREQDEYEVSPVSRGAAAQVSLRRRLSPLLAGPVGDGGDGG